MLRSIEQSVTSFIVKWMSLVIIFSLIIIGYSIFTLASSLNDAEMINASSSLRTQIYRITIDVKTNDVHTLQHIDDFEDTLYGPTMRQLNNWWVPNNISAYYRQLVLDWKSIKRTLISQHNVSLTQQVDPYIRYIEQFEYKLQHYNERKLTTLAWVAALCLSGVILICLVVVRYTRNEIVKPLKRLSQASQNVREGKFDVSLSGQPHNELGELMVVFNGMSQELGQLYQGLEIAVDEKTRHLRMANQSLQVLYQSSQELSSSRLTVENFQVILDYFCSLEGVISAEVQVIDAGGQGLTLHAGERYAEYSLHRELSVDGVLLGYLRWKEGLPCPDKILIKNFLHIFEQAIHYAKSQKQSEQLLLLEERATIARELHDSLAQSLSYLKIQVSLLKRSMLADDHETLQASANPVIAELDTGLSSAYKQLRELLTTFRLTLKESSFGQALNEVVDQLRARTSAIINLDNLLVSFELSAQQQVHLVQLIREATINAIKHAQASHITIYCGEENGVVTVYIKDDGIGFSDPPSKVNHYGMNIMYERAQRLGGQLHIDSEPNQGCKVSITYPANKKGDLS
ncbi:nitrate/nitrite two-component system sensor histidine kinase NarQ [Vibrio palustris]|uniref:Sensor protein n=1 Tax=Vibrio palustris TaxID=1918946 RepID=A0A1R4B6Z8_9VIBR|nr:nitrate/nitrite two-component system sensor histidine kinase NarQ [Vibrio palustris]SJL84695.1 Nitrate/nitrite sensor protein NarX [Vibrio palustris]